MILAELERDAPPAQPAPLAERRVQMTEAQFYALPDRRVEFVRGEAIFMSPVSWLHAELFGWLLEYTRRLARKHNTGRVFGESLTVRLSPDVSRVPDVVFVATANDRVRFQPNHLEGPPDLIIEIVSPESRGRDYHEKRVEYEAAGVGEYWIIDPTYQTVDFYHLVNGVYQSAQSAPDGTLVSTRLTGFRLRPDWLKLNPLPNPDTLI
jgi:Uma2 family endonuclease